MKNYYILTKKGLVIILSVILAVICAVVIFSTANSSKSVSASEKKIPIYSVETEQKVLSISFDAAWGADDTDEIIDTLDKYDVKATFFVVSQWVEKYPNEVKKLFEAGHEIMNHSSTHPYMTSLSKEQMVQEIEDCNKKIEAITKVRPTLFRAPYGDYNNDVIQTVESLEMYTIQWSVDSLDWKGLSADEISKRVLNKATSGSIVLFHNDAAHTPKALPSILEKLKGDGYQFKKISELIYTENYTIDHNGMQKKAGE